MGRKAAGGDEGIAMRWCGLMEDRGEVGGNSALYDGFQPAKHGLAVLYV